MKRPKFGSKMILQRSVSQLLRNPPSVEDVMRLLSNKMKSPASYPSSPEK